MRSEYYNQIIKHSRRYPICIIGELLSRHDDVTAIGINEKAALPTLVMS